jgi:hypothetical protein
MSDIDNILHRDDLSPILEKVLSENPKDLVMAWYDEEKKVARFYWIGSIPMAYGLLEILHQEIEGYTAED